MDTKGILEIIQRNGKNRAGLIAILEEIQAEYAYLPEAALRLVAKETGRSLADVYGVATFYKAFSLKPKGRHCISVCLGTACHVRGAQKIVEEFSQELGIKPGETTPDNEVTLETVNCLGACALGPTVVADGRYFPHVCKNKVNGIIDAAVKGLEHYDEKTDGRIFPLEVSCPVCRKSLMSPDHHIDGRPSVSLEVSLDGRRDRLHFSSLYGSRTPASGSEIPPSSVSRFHCPHCRNEIPCFSDCLECGSPMAALYIREGVVWEICTRRGCPGHMLNLRHINLHRADEGK
ncbi:MAG TPA: NAD(P)H-dependent oxidoreductase subunit E [Deltaproteobacteria bacterium]|nr:NAD(P)H-dependent oxidoreductase subunit E [Deltaproteobacteria bacterium]HQJ08381.1 NAD(P)H-dependent oxidoreductase subunit E [Deltaproteobacteria bacterium]